MHAQPFNPSLDLWFDSPQRIPAPNPTNNASHEVDAEEPMDISSPPSPVVANLLHDVSEEAIEGALTSAHVNPVPEEPPIIGAYPGSPIRSAVVSPWVGSEDVEEELQCDLVVPEVVMEQQQPSSNPEPLPPKETENFFTAAEGTSTSSIIAQASESAEHLAEDAASDIDADGDADVDPIPSVAMSPSFEPASPYVSTPVAGPSSTDAGAPGAITGLGMTVDARLSSLDEALVNLWGNVLRMQIAHRKTQTDHKQLSDRTEALAARLDAAQADLRSAMGANEDAEVLRTRVQVAEDLMAELQGRLSSAEAAVAEAAKAQAELRMVEQQAAAAAKVVESDVSTPTRKRKRAAEDAGEEADDDDGSEVRLRFPKAQRRKRARRFAWAAVHTAAAAAVGAVAAWSALAFA